MPVKKKGRRGRKKKVNPGSAKNEYDAKQELFQSYLNNLDVQSESYLKYVDEECELACQKIQKMYHDKLAGIPKKYLHMTIEEYMVEQEISKNVSDASDTKVEDICSMFERKHKQVTESGKKKKRLFSSKLDSTHRRSFSCPGGKARKALAVMQQAATPLCSRNRVFSEAMLQTPLTKRALASKMVVTPKFNPRTPLVNALCRRPRVGEIVMSLSGSPIQNFAETESDAPSVIVKLGKGKVINISEDSNVDVNSAIRDIDEETRAKVKSMQEKLQQILSS